MHHDELPVAVANLPGAAAAAIRRRGRAELIRPGRVTVVPGSLEMRRRVSDVMPQLAEELGRCAGGSVAAVVRRPTTCGQAPDAGLGTSA